MKIASKAIPSLYPLIVKPKFVAKPWGDRRLESRFGMPIPPEIPVGESWSLHEDCRIANGPLAGTMLHSAGFTPPFVFKFLDVSDTHSVQVHPSPAYARRHKTATKDEMWFFLEPPTDGYILANLSKGTRPEDFTAKTGEALADCFEKIPVKKHDLVLIPSGTIHALTAGSFVAELQEPPQITLRLSDWGRVDSHGKQRELHIAEGLEALDPGSRVEVFPMPASKEKMTTLAKMARLQLNKLPTGHHTLTCRNSGLCCIEGTLTLSSQDEPITLTAGQTCYLPAGLRTATVEIKSGYALELIHL